MALSKPVVPDTVLEEPVIAQHFLVDGNGNCEKNCQFYCNPCHLPICEQCREKHQKSPDTKNHDVVPYRQRRRELPVEKCKDHPTKDIVILCEDCKVPLCYKCALQDHQKHTLTDLETIYSERFTLYLREIHKIHQYFLPTTKDIQSVIKKDAKNIKAVMDEIREYMKSGAEFLKSLVDTLTSDNIEQANKIEESIVENLQSQENKYKEYICYLEDLVKEFQGYLSSTKLQNNPIIFSFSDQLKIQPIPEAIKPYLSIFPGGQCSKENVSKLLVRVTVSNIKPENREIKHTENASTHLKLSGKQRKQDDGKSDVKPTLSSSVTKVREYTVPGVDNVHHISLDKSGKIWASDDGGSLVQTDLVQENQLQEIQTCGGSEGYHTVTKDGVLIYKGLKNKVVKRITVDNTITDYIKTGDWEPLSIHSSHINGDILIGMRNGKDAKVTRYNKTGEEIQNIQRDNKGHGMYKYPHYITENINSDICVSDLNKGAVVVVDKSGRCRFCYRGPWSTILPFGICTDLLGHIIVCDGCTMNRTVDILDQDGQFLFRLTTQQGVVYPRSVFVDDENNLHVGQWNNSKVKVFKYLQ